MTQNLWDTAEAVLRGTFNAIQSHLKKQEKSHKQSNLTAKATRERRRRTTTKKPKLVEGKKSWRSEQK